jgi:DNA-binding NarL/FixJ family response regulator
VGSVLRVLVVDDAQLMADSLAALIKVTRPDLETHVAYTTQDAIFKLATYPISLAFIDARMPGTSGIELIQTLRQKKSALKIVGITSFAQPATLTELVQAGIDGLLLKNQANAEELKLCLNTVLAGAFYISAAAQQIVSQPGISKHPIQLSKRELEVLQLICKGKTSKEIAEELNLKPGTIEDYRKSMLKRTGCSNTDQLATVAQRNGLL